MAEAISIANFFLHLDALHDGEGISNLKLQKLAYYAQGYYCAIHDTPLFNEHIEAWTHGPVVPQLYQEFKRYGADRITPPQEFDPACLTEKEREMAEEVFQVFGQFSAWKLRDMTHEESPWQNHENSAGTIPIDEMKAYFKTRI